INAASILISDALPFGRLWYGGPNASDFVIKKITAPHTDGMKSGFFPRPQSWNEARRGIKRRGAIYRGRCPVFATKLPEDTRAPELLWNEFARQSAGARTNSESLLFGLPL